MVYEWFLIALPVVFLLGWFSARLDIRHIRKTAGELPRAYLSGLSHLLRGEKNRALEWFLHAQPLAPESAELQFAIGELSRTRGEHRRALNVHLNLCERESLGDDQRRRARWELAADYFEMGFFDLAEKHATLLSYEEDYRSRAEDMLLDICQRAHDYERALVILQNMPAEAALMRRQTHAHLVCECAQSPMNKELLKSALAIDGQCARANLLLGALAMEEQCFEESVQHYAAIERQNTDYLWCAVPGIMTAFESLNQSAAGGKKILAWLAAYPSPILFNAVYRQLASRGTAEGLAAQSIESGLGLAAAAAWAEEQCRQSDDARRDFWRALKKTVAANINWRCERCGYQTGDFVWQCHNCLSWESFQRAPS